MSFLLIMIPAKGFNGHTVFNSFWWKLQNWWHSLNLQKWKRFFGTLTNVLLPLLAKNSHYKKKKIYSQNWQFSVFRVALQTNYFWKGKFLLRVPLKILILERESFNASALRVPGALSKLKDEYRNLFNYSLYYKIQCSCVWFWTSFKPDLPL